MPTILIRQQNLFTYPCFPNTGSAYGHARKGPPHDGHGDVTALSKTGEPGNVGRAVKLGGHAGTLTETTQTEGGRLQPYGCTNKG